VGIENVLIYLTGGILAGILSGYIGIGGGIVFLPFLYLDSTMSGQTIVATSGFAILFTSVSSFFRHHSMENINWSFYPIFFSGIMGAIIGSNLSSSLPSILLKQIITVIIIIIAVYSVLLAFSKATRKKISVGRWLAYLVSFMIGTLSGGIGISGGVLFVPFLIYFYNFEPHTAVGTTTLMSLGVALFSSIVFIIRGINSGFSMPWHLGYINVYAALILAAGSIPAAQLGAWLHKFRSPKIFYLCFSVALIIIAIKMFMSTYL